MYMEKDLITMFSLFGEIPPMARYPLGVDAVEISGSMVSMPQFKPLPLNLVLPEIATAVAGMTPPASTYTSDEGSVISISR